MLVRQKGIVGNGLARFIKDDSITGIKWVRAHY